MKVKGVTYFHHNLILKKPLQTSLGSIEERTVYLLRIDSDNGIRVFGESAPLPEFGSESFEEAVDAFRMLIPQMIDCSLPKSMNEVDDFLSQYRLPSTVRAALEQCVIEILIKNYNNSLFPKTTQISSNGLLSLSDTESTIARVSSLVHEGFTTLKIKIGIEEFSKELKVLRQIKESFLALKLRLDVNGKWEMNNATNYLNELKEIAPEYVEQPVRDLNELNTLAEQSPVPLAADESIRSVQVAENVISDTAIEYLIIKPMFVGGIMNTKRIIREAKERDKKVIISSSLESNIGRRSLILATSLADNITHGISTCGLFTNDIIEDLFPVQSGSVNFLLKTFTDHQYD